MSEYNLRLIHLSWIICISFNNSLIDPFGMVLERKSEALSSFPIFSS